MKTNYPLTYILEYVPSRYLGLNAKQMQDRHTVWNFKDGVCSDEVKNGILHKVSNVVSGKEGSSVVCFLPASSKVKTQRRYSSLTDYLRSKLGCEVRMDAITLAYDKQSGYQNGKSDNPIENMMFNGDAVRGKHVVIIDDVITRGRTFNMAASRLMECGALSVYGVFLAKTIHPDLPIGKPESRHYGESDWMYENDLVDIELMNELAQEEMANAELQEIAIQEEIDDAMMREEIMQEIMAEQTMWEEEASMSMDDVLAVNGLSWGDIM